jgi:ferredoxin
MDPKGITPVQVPGSNSVCYICGPQSFEEDVRSFLKDYRVADQNIRSESFSAPGSSPDTAADGTVSDGDNNPQNFIGDATVRLTKSKRDATWRSEENCSILELAEKAGLTPSYGCRAGACGSCTARLVSGRVNGGSQLDRDNVLLCSARPATAVVEVEI